MIHYLVRTPTILSALRPDMHWSGDPSNKTVYLTFDDGPDPDITPWVLDVLKVEKIQASFFLIGNNAAESPELVKRIIKEGHGIGNHTQNHVSGWKTKLEEYVQDVESASKQIKSDFFRPPYGRIRPSQINALKTKYNIVMWGIMSGDFDHRVKPEVCKKNILSNLSPGAIILMHDTVKAAHNLKAVLPDVIKEIKAQGYIFGTIADFKDLRGKG